MDESSHRIRLIRDNQQWELDRAIKDSGRVSHFEQAGRGRLPETVRTHAMISKQVGKRAERLERLAKAEAEAGHSITALEFYFDAASLYSNAQHTIFQLNEEKRRLHLGAMRCYGEVRRLAPYTIEHLTVPWRGGEAAGYLHLAPVDGPAPLIFFVPGCDMTKEQVPHPLYNFAAQRGMHLFSFDGPGQGECNLRGLKLTTDNYEEAATAAITQLLDRPEIDSNLVGLYALSFGSYWGARLAATDGRIAAAALVWASICDKYYLFEEESPRYKQLFAFLTGASSEDELDTFIAEMDVRDHLPRVACPTLLTVGEYDPRSPLEEVYDLVDSMTAPREVWVYADQHHTASLRGGHAMSWYGDHHVTAVDWLADHMSGRQIEGSPRVSYLEAGGRGPNDPAVEAKRHWYE